MPTCRALTAVLAASGLLLTGCSLADIGGEPTAPLPTESGSPPDGKDALAPYYEQELEWEPCGSYECTALSVPLDYAEPQGESIELAVLRVPAAEPDQRIGSLVVNPGGPGGSGVQYATAADFIVGEPVREAFDIVGFDPRGVGLSAPIDCVEDAALDEFLGSDPTPDDPGERKEFAAGAKDFAGACGANAGPLLGHVSTVDAAKDMDILRAALGEKQLNYLGKSYGTYLGTIYAEHFPENVGRFVLDGAIAPDLTNQEINLGQAKGFERATRAWAASCVDEGDCPLGGSVDEVMEGLRGLLADLDDNPVPISDPRVEALTEGWASLGVAAAMYDQGSWGVLTQALRALVERDDGDPLMSLANTYARRDPSGTYQSNIMEVIYAVNCLDRPASSDISEYAAFEDRADDVAPTWGPFLAWSSMPCGYWPIEATGEAHTVAAKGSNTIVVVGTTRDPATPYEWAVRLNEQLANSVLVTYDGDGHTAYTRSNSCVNDAIDAYFVEGTVPEEGLTC